MKKLISLLVISCLLTSSAWAAIQWRNGTAEQVLDGTSNSALIGYNSYNKVVQPLDNLLSTYCTEYLQYKSSTTITVKAGSCVVSNSQGSIRMFMLDTSDTDLTTANLDAGVAFAAGTTYYVYATSPNATTQASTYYISTSNSAPTGQTYYYQIGNFTTNSSSAIGAIVNNNHYNEFGASSAKSAGVNYQALTDGIVHAYSPGTACCLTSYSMTGYTDSTSTPTTVVQQQTEVTSGYFIAMGFGFSFAVKKGDYYRVDGSNVSPTVTFRTVGK